MDDPRNAGASGATTLAVANPADEIATVQGALRTTLRALAVCAIRASDQGTFDRLATRARTLADRLADAVYDLDDEMAADSARRTAAGLLERLVDLERLHADRTMH